MEYISSEHWLLEKIASLNNRIAVIYREKVINYQQLFNACNRWRAILFAENVQAGDVVGIKNELNFDLCALILALLANNNIFSLVGSLSKENQDKHLKEARVNHVFTFDDHEQYTITRYSQTSNHPLYEQLKNDNQSGLVLFTSGTTGKSKCVVYNTECLIEKYKNKNHSYKTLAFLPIDHLGGLDTFFGTLATGGTLIIPEDRTPHATGKSIEAHAVELLPTTPTFLNLLLAAETHKISDLNSLKRITYGSEPIHPETLKQLQLCLPRVQLKQAYGMSEVGVIPSYSPADDSQWLQFREDIQYKIIEGILYLKLKTAMLGYLNATSPINEEGWFNTGDHVQTDIVNGKEYIKIIGRENDIINVGGNKVHPTEIEAILSQIPCIKEVMVYGRKNAVIGEIVVARLTLHDYSINDRECYNIIKQFCTDILEPYKIPQLIEISYEPLHGSRFKKSRLL